MKSSKRVGGRARGLIKMLMLTPNNFLITAITMFSCMLEDVYKENTIDFMVMPYNYLVIFAMI